MKKYHKILSIILILVVVALAGWWAWREYQGEKPVVTDIQKTQFEGLIDGYDAQIKQDPKNRFLYMDKADYQRQLGDPRGALKTLAEAYAIKGDWKDTPDFLVAEARAWGQIDPQEGMVRYEALIARELANEQFYSEYISFLKHTNQPREKIIDYYQRAISAIPGTLLADEYQDYIAQKPTPTS